MTVALSTRPGDDAGDVQTFTNVARVVLAAGRLRVFFVHDASVSIAMSGIVDVTILAEDDQ